MAAATLLYVGDDYCRRIPVLQRAGMTVVRSECSLTGIRGAMTDSVPLDIIAFHNDFHPIPNFLVAAVRESVDAPFVLFESAEIPCDEAAFDLVIPPLTLPGKWINKLQIMIEASQKTQAISRQLRADSANVRAVSQALRASIRNALAPIDSGDPWRRADELERHRRT